MAGFRTSARTVDMLGRQQIAGIPTAISELFKNAHDAYATEAVADFLRDRNLFVLRDDGDGMSRSEFEDRWLMLGTSSKAVPGKARSDRPRRAILGEKGIGRLAIAAIGPQVLIVTRKQGEPSVTVALIHWGLFELMYAQLSQIPIPLIEMRPGQEPNLTAMAATILESVTKLATNDDASVVERVTADLLTWSTLDLAEVGATVGTNLLSPDKGTAFVIVPSSPDLTADLEPQAPKEAPPLLRTLIGFANTMTPGHRRPELRTAFRDHRAIDHVHDVIAEGEFFTPDDFVAADHHFQGHFDEHGRFGGTVTIFGNEPIPYPLVWNGARGAPTRCGPFDLSLAYVQGKSKHSRLDGNEYAVLIDKLDRYGGLYIYRDNIRVLPYGDSRFDWLDVEIRRSKSASDNFFSYRRMFGTVEITRARNHDLREKAGREGFATNEAYRQFRAILQNFLVQVAAEFFRENAPQADEYEEGRRANERMHKAMLVRNRRVRARRAAYADHLNSFFDAVNHDIPATEAAQIVARLRAESDLAALQGDPAVAADMMIKAEGAARDELGILVGSIRVNRPRGVGLSAELTRRAVAYEAARDELVNTVIVPTQRKVDEVTARADDIIGAATARRLRLDQAISNAVSLTRKQFSESRARLAGIVKPVPSRANRVTVRGHRNVETVVDEVLNRASTANFSSFDDADFIGLRSTLEHQLANVVAIETEFLDSLSDQLGQLAWDEPRGGGSLLDQIQSLEERLEGATSQADQDFELVQLGLAVNIVTHEFENSVKAVRSNLRRLRSWAQQNPDMRPLYTDLRASFDHLDGYLKLFTPLNRRLYRKPVSISGIDVKRYLDDVFRQRLAEADVGLSSTRGFDTMNVKMYPSTLYSAMVGLVDNAIFWVSGYRGDRRIVLSYEGGIIAVTDSGPGVRVEDAEHVFRRGYTRKPAGTGYGLFVAKQVLERDGAKLRLAPGHPDSGARFEIVPPALDS